MKWQALVGLTTLCIHVILALWLLRHESLRPRWNPAKSREIARFSLLTWFSNLGSVLFTQCDRLVIGRLLGAESLGIYGAVTTVTIQLNALSNLPSQPLVPFISQIKTRREFQNDTVRRQVQHSFEMNVLVALGLGIALFVMASLILKIFFPPLLEKNYLAIFQIAVVITAVYSVNTTGYYLMLGVRAVKECMWIQIVTAVVTLALIFLGAWWGGLLGAVVGSLGYQATWLYTILGMKKIELPARAWLGWIGPYAMSFGAVILLSLVLPPNLMLKTALTIAALLSLGGVFLWRHRKQFLRSFKLPTYINSWRSW